MFGVCSLLGLWLWQERGAPSQEDEQVLVMNNERFSIPEVLLNPSMVGIDQAGVAEAIVQAINACPEVGMALSFVNPPLSFFQDFMENSFVLFLGNARLDVPKHPPHWWQHCASSSRGENVGFLLFFFFFFFLGPSRR